VSRRERPLSWAGRAERAGRIGTRFARVYLRIRATRWIDRVLRPTDMPARWSAVHRRSAEEIYEAAVELRGLILKGCQFLGSRADVLPPEYVEVLSRLQDRVPPRPFEEVRRCVEHELGRPLRECFAEFEEQSLAAASLAQVHRARLPDGRRVAVKVQYPEIASLVRSDLANLRMLFRAVDLLEADFDPMPLVEELGQAVPRELDFENEARNAERIARDFEHRDDVLVPGIVHELTTRRLLVMEYIDGIKITDVERLRAAGVDLAQVSSTLVEIFCEQLLVTGFFHADPHPGNLLVLPAQPPRIVLLDFGLAKELPPGFRKGVLDFAAGLIRGDTALMARSLVELGFETRDGEPQALNEVAAVILHAAQEVRAQAGLDPKLLQRLRKEIPERVRRNPIVRIPHHLVLVGRVVGLLSGVQSSLGTRVDLLRAVAPYALGTPPGRSAER